MGVESTTVPIARVITDGDLDGRLAAARRLRRDADEVGAVRQPAPSNVTERALPARRQRRVLELGHRRAGERRRPRR